jgi:CHASE3 domain sensor protein
MGFFTYLWSVMGRTWSPRCPAWTPEIIRWAHVGDLATFLAYITIGGLPALIACRLTSLPGYAKLALLLSTAFILACGTGHFLDVYTHFTGNVELLAASKVTTAIISWAAVLASYIGYFRYGRMAVLYVPEHHSGEVKPLLISGFAVLAMGTLGVLTWDAISSQTARSGERAEVAILLRDNSKMGELVCDAETGQRGYLLTRKEAYLIPYQEAIDELQNCKAQWTRSIALKLEELATTVALGRAGQYEQAMQIVLNDSGNLLMAEIRREVHNRDQDLSLLAAQKEAEWNAARIRLLFVMPGVGLLSMGAIGFSLWLAIHDARAKVAAEREMANLLWAEHEARSTAENAKTELADRLRLFNSISHDLRTPIQAMGFLAELVEMGVGVDDKESIARAVVDMKAQVRIVEIRGKLRDRFRIFNLRCGQGCHLIDLTDCRGEGYLDYPGCRKCYGSHPPNQREKSDSEFGL